MRDDPAAEAPPGRLTGDSGHDQGLRGGHKLTGQILT